MAQDGVKRLGLGTAQFGLDYGITNAAGRISSSAAAAILAEAAAAGIDTLDTAHLYGHSEEVLGGVALPGRDFRIVTKTPKLSQAAGEAEAVAMLRQAFAQSLAKLQRSCVYGLLLHDADDLLGPFGPALWSVMQELRGERLVERIGVSVYDGRQIDLALERFDPDLVQLPINPLDRRLIEGGQLARLAQRGVEVHARSLFLQGLLLASPDKVPLWLAPLRPAIEHLHARFAAARLSPLQGVLAWMSGQPIHRLICGVTSLAELQDIASAAEKAHRRGQEVDLAGAPSIDPVYLNPARWPALAAAAPDRSKRT